MIDGKREERGKDKTSAKSLDLLIFSFDEFSCPAS